VGAKTRRNYLILCEPRGLPGNNWTGISSAEERNIPTNTVIKDSRTVTSGLWTCAIILDSEPTLELDLEGAAWTIRRDNHRMQA